MGLDLGRWLKDRKDQAARQWQNSVVLDAVSSNTQADQARRAAQGTPTTVRQQAANTYGGGVGSIVNRARDVLDANTQADMIKRKAASGLFETYQDQQNRLTEITRNAQSDRGIPAQVAASGLREIGKFFGKAPGAVGNIYGSIAQSDNPIVQVGRSVIPGMNTFATADRMTGNEASKNMQRQANDLTKQVEQKINQNDLVGEKQGENKWAVGLGSVAGQLPAQLATGGVGLINTGVQMASDEYNKARAAGRDNDAALGIGTLQGVASAASEKLGIDKFLPGNGVAGNTVIKALKRFGTEGAQEGEQQFIQNLIANKSYNPNQGLKDGVFESVILGGIAGGAMSPMADIANIGTTPNQTQLTPELQTKRSDLANSYTQAQQAGRPDLAQGIARQIDQIDNPQPGTLREQIRSAKQRVITPLNEGGYISTGNPRVDAEFSKAEAGLAQLDALGKEQAKLGRRAAVASKAYKEGGLPTSNEQAFLKAVDKPLAEKPSVIKRLIAPFYDERGSIQISQEPIGDVEAKIKQLNPNLDIATLNDRQKRIALANIEQQQGRSNVDTGQKMFGSKKDMAKMRRITAENIQEIENEGERVAAKMVTKARVLGEDAKYTVNRSGDPAVENYKKLAVSAIPNNPAQNPEARGWFVKNTDAYIQKVKSATSIAEVKQAAKEYLDSASTEKTFNKYDGTTQTYTANDVKKHLGSRSYNMLRGYSSAMRSAEYRPPTDFSFDEKKTTTRVTTDGKPKPQIHGGEQVEYERKGAPGLKNKDPKSMVKDFGFKGLEYGNYVKNSESNEHMAKFGDSMLDLEKVLGIDMSALNSQAKLGVGFGSRGSGMALAHYEPSNKVINITKKNTVDGSLAHEYMHAIDDFLGGSEKGGLYASNGRAAKPATKQAIDELMSAIKKGDGSYSRTATLPENYRNPYKSWSAVDALIKNTGDAQATINTMVANYPNTGKSQMDRMVNYVMDKTGTTEVQVPTGKSEFYTLAQEQGAYWERPTEMLARAFDGYIGNKLDQAGVKNNYVAKGQRSPGLMHPNEAHAKQLEPLFDNLFKAVKSDYNLPDPIQRATSEVEAAQPSKTQADFDAELRAKSVEQLKKVNKQVTTGLASSPKQTQPPKTVAPVESKTATGARSDYSPENLQANRQIRVKNASSITYADKKTINPDELVTVYRAVPGKAKGGLVEGDWVTPNKEQARLFMKQSWAQDDTGAKIVTKKVKASELRYHADDAKGYVDDELLYVPQPKKPFTPISQPVDNLPAIVKQVTKAKTPKPAPKPVVQKAVKPVAPKPTKPETKQRGFTKSVQEAPNVDKKTKKLVDSEYKTKENDVLMGEAKALLSENASIDFKSTKDLDKKVAATMQQAINLQASGDHDAAAALYNNLSEHGTELGRGVQAFSLLKNMSPEAVSLSVAGRIKKYNATHRRQIPELTGEQQKQISDKIIAADLLKGREKNIALNEIDNMVASYIPSSFADKALAVWKAGLLTSLRTHERNFIGNSIHGISETVKDVPAAAADMLMSATTGKRTVTTTAKGVVEGLKAFGNKSTRQQIKDIVGKGYDPSEQLNKFDYRKVTWGNNLVEKGLKGYTEAVFRTLGASDKPFYNAAMARSLYNSAAVEAINQGKRGDKALIESLVKTPTEQMMKDAISDANVSTFKNRNQATNVVTSIKRTMSQNEYGKVAAEITMPFTGVPTSILGEIVAYSPIGLVKGAAKVGAVTSGKVPDLQRSAAQELGKGTVGSSIFALGAYLMAQGLMTGQPKDDDEAKQWELENKPRNSILIGGKWRSLNSIGPEAVVFLAGAKAAETAKNPEGSVAEYATNIGKDYLDQSFVRGLQSPVNALTDPKRYAKSYLGQTASSVIPNIIKDAAKAGDSKQRETNTIGDYLKSGIPGARNTLLPRRDLLGNEMKQEPTGIGAFTDLFNSKTPIKNDVVTELGRLNSTGNNATPSKLSASQTINGEKIKLTPKELDALEQATGEPIRQQFAQLMATPEYKNASDETKNTALTKIVNGVRGQAKSGIASGTSGVSSMTKDAQLVLAKDSFDKSGKSYQVVGDTVLRRSTDGTISATPKIKFDYQVGSATLTQQKKAGDMAGWMKTAEGQLNSIDTQLKDPSIDPLEAIQLQNQAQTLMDSMEKYAGYGGFKKGRSGGRGGSGKTAKDETIAFSNALQSSTLKRLNSLLAGTSKPVTGSKRVATKKPVLKKITVKA